MIRLFLLLHLPMICFAQQPLYQNNAFTVYPDRVEEGEYTAVASDANTISSTYKSRYRQPTKRRIDFKFSLNGLDNEAFPGQDHRFNLRLNAANCTTPVYTFGALHKQDYEPPPAKDIYLQQACTVTVRLDMNPVLQEMKTKGAFTTFNGERIAAEDFKGVYVAGSTLPLTWEFANLIDRPEAQLTDPDGDGIYTIDLTFAPFQQEIRSAEKQTWSLKKKLSEWPQFHSDFQLLNALYTMSLEEMLLDVRKDGAFMAGAKWPGVWTRDISYSILLSLAMIHPEAAKQSLRAKVRDGHIIQDTGTGGSWPVSTDRMTWALAAYEIYLATQDREWLEYIHGVISRSVNADRHAAFDPQTGLVRGESSFLDWREQTYPGWMEPKDIYHSQCLGTNAVHFRTYEILAESSRLLGLPYEQYQRIAEQIKSAMNEHLWLTDEGYYGQYLYGREHMALSPRSETLGEALSMLFGIADAKQASSILQNMSATAYGPTCIYPQIPDIPPYHNNGIWPFVVSYYTWAAAQNGTMDAVEFGLGSIYRAAALFLTNKENFVAETGDYMGTEINSDRQLWSVAGTLATIYRVLFGMNMFADDLSFSPCVPKTLDGTMSLKGVSYGQAMLDIELVGYGSGIKRMTVDGDVVVDYKIPSTSRGRHSVRIELDGAVVRADIHLADNAFTPGTPEVILTREKLHWQPVENALNYKIVKNGELIKETEETFFVIEQEDRAEYQAAAQDAAGRVSFLSKPVIVGKKTNTIILQIEDAVGQSANDDPGFNGRGYVELTKEKNRVLSLPATINQTGTYRICFRYANGAGPVNTDNRCALRTLLVDNAPVGVIVLPQRGANLWSDWGMSSSVFVELTTGDHVLTLSLTDLDKNMNGDMNRAWLDECILIRQ